MNCSKVGALSKKYLSSEQRKAALEACRPFLAEEMKKHDSTQLDNILWCLYCALDCTEEQMIAFCDAYSPLINDYVNRYEVNPEDVPSVCAIKLKNAGFNLDKIKEHAKISYSIRYV